MGKGDFPDLFVEPVDWIVGFIGVRYIVAVLVVGAYVVLIRAWVGDDKTAFLALYQCETLFGRSVIFAYEIVGQQGMFAGGTFLQFLIHNYLVR